MDLLQAVCVRFAGIVVHCAARLTCQCRGSSLASVRDHRKWQLGRDRLKDARNCSNRSARCWRSGWSSCGGALSSPQRKVCSCGTERHCGCRKHSARQELQELRTNFSRSKNLDVVFFVSLLALAAGPTAIICSRFDPMQCCIDHSNGSGWFRASTLRQPWQSSARWGAS